MVYRAAAWLTDAVLVGLTVTILGVLLTGGGAFSIGALRVSVRSIDNPLLFLLIVAGLRWWRARATPFLGVRSFALADLDLRALRLCRCIADYLSTLTRSRALAIIAAITVVSLALRVINAYVHYGFFAGDDVEIHEMTVGALFRRDWPVWNLRNAFYPMTFIYPAQWIALQLGFSSTGALIFAGRLVVALFSALTCLLLFRVARLYFGIPVALLSAAILAASHLHVNIGSTELPRPVAAFFLVAAFGLSLRRGLFAGAAAGVMLGLAGAMRFGEVVFIVPALAILLAEERRADAVATAVAFGVALLVVTGVADLIYWGTPFYSFRNAVDFTLLKGLSSRGYQPFHYYFSHIGEWSNLYVVGLGLGAIWLRYWTPAAWAWIPVAGLSLLPHKEARYMVPVLPFLALAAGSVLWTVLDRLRSANSRRSSRVALAIVAASIAALVLEAGGFRFTRSERAVDMAITFHDDWRREGVAIEQIWRVGGRLYLGDVAHLQDIDLGRLSEPGYLEGLLADPNVGWTAWRAESVTDDRLAVVHAFDYAEVWTDSASGYRVFRKRSVRAVAVRMP